MKSYTLEDKKKVKEWINIQGAYFSTQSNFCGETHYR